MKIRKIELIIKGLRTTIDLGSNPKKDRLWDQMGEVKVLDQIFINNQYISVGNTATKGIEYHRLSMERTFEATQNVKIEFDDGNDFIQKYNLRNNQGTNNTIFSFRSPYR